jgi:membrane fusion protein, multidrug efflux system
LSLRRILLLALAALVALLTVRFVSSRLAPAPVPSASPVGGAAEPLRSVGVVVAPASMQETARSVGTLVANESVDIVPELSRRLVRVLVTEGAFVEKGALLFALDDAAVRAELAELEAGRVLAARTAERQRQLVDRERKALSAQAIDQGRAELDAIEARIEALKVTLAQTQLRAPFAGRVGIRRVSEGAWVTPETILTTLQDTSRIKIDFTLPEQYAPSIRVGQPFEFTVAGQPETFQAKVTVIEPRIDSATRSLLVRGETPNETGALLPGGFATVEVPLEASVTGVSVPAEALVPSIDGHGVYVFQVGRAELRPVEIGRRTATTVQVVRGLEAGETVLTTNLLRLAPGIAVELAEPAAGIE